MAYDHNKYQRAYYHAHREKALTRGRRRRQEKADYVESQRTRCVDCGNDDRRVLEFDHVNGKPTMQNAVRAGTKKQRRALPDMGWDALKAELATCEVRCANCHKIRHTIS